MIESLSVRRSMYAAFYAQQSRAEKEPGGSEQEKTRVDAARTGAEEEPRSVTQSKMHRRFARMIEQVRAGDPEGFDEKSKIRGTPEYCMANAGFSKAGPLEQCDVGAVTRAYRDAARQPSRPKTP